MRIAIYRRYSTETKTFWTVDVHHNNEGNGNRNRNSPDADIAAVNINDE